MKPTLVVLAAGMGSRYGALKQMDAFGPSGETIIDYSIYDAINAGFGKVVFIIRESFKSEFEDFFAGKFEDKIEVAFVTQELNKIPEGSKVNPDREKPWGTAHAVLMAREEVNTPFAVINADDYYGVDAYKTLAEYFETAQKTDASGYAVVAYKLKNTLSDHGTVNRGVCYSNNNGFLDRVEECLKIKRNDNGVIEYPGENKTHVLSEETLVSMNLWGFGPSFFDYAEEHFKEFLEEYGNELKSEFFIPLVVDKLINDKGLNVNVLSSDSNWFGVTYQEDKPIVINKLNKLIDSGVYPKSLWG